MTHRIKIQTNHNNNEHLYAKATNLYTLIHRLFDICETDVPSKLHVCLTDLTKFGSLLMMGVVGLIIAMLVNFFMKSQMMDYVISIIGVLIFTGLTAYDVQRLKKIGTMVDNSGSMVLKMSILGALTLYLDFINLFLFLLRLMGGRK